MDGRGEVQAHDGQGRVRLVGGEQGGRGLRVGPQCAGHHDGGVGEPECLVLPEFGYAPARQAAERGDAGDAGDAGPLVLAGAASA